MKENGRILQVDNLISLYIKVNTIPVNQYQHLLLNTNLTFNFDEVMNVVNHVYYVVINRLSWMDSTYTCCNYFKTYMCIHIMSVAVSCGLVKVPPHCK